MDIVIQNNSSKDYKKAIKYVGEGMHFTWYCEDKLTLYLYSRYFLFSEMLRATEITGAYMNGEFAGLMVARENGKNPCYKSLSKRVYVSLFEFILRLFYKKSAGEFESACADMRRCFFKNYTADLEIVLLSVNPKMKNKGIGTALLNDLSSKHSGERVYLLTDSGCDYGFYDRKGFQRAEERNITLKLKDDIPFKCMLYSKIL